MMMARPCFVALLCVALWCGMAFAQDDAAPAETQEEGNGNSEVAAGQDGKEPTEAAAGSTTTSSTTTEGTGAAGGDEASSSTDENGNGAATLSVSLSSLMIATLLAKVYAH